MNDVRDVFGGHHLWCNGSSRAPVKGCRWCDPDGDGKRGLWASYPYTTGAEANNLAAQHFPNVVKRPGTGYAFPEDVSGGRPQ
jgi:hypothetical protein